MDSTPIGEVVVGATRKILRVQFKDEAGVPIALPDASGRLQGKSPELSGVELDIVGALYDAGNGIFEWTSIGTAITSVQLGALPKADFRLRAKITDNAGKTDYSSEFVFRWVATPI